MTPTWVLDVPFEMRGVAAASGADWDKNAKASVWRGAQLPHTLRPFAALPFSWEWSRQHALNGRHLEPVERLTPTFLPRPHQQVAAEAMSQAFEQRSPGFLLADEVGVGKTLSAWQFALQTPDISTILVVTTASAMAHWRHSILHAGWQPHHRILIINYDRLGKLFEVEGGLSSARAKGKRKRIAREGQAPAFDLIIFDESHKGKTPDSARGLMMRKLGHAAGFCIWASATAGQTPIELIYLAPLLARATNSRPPATDINAFADWCRQQGLRVSKGPYGSIVWERNDDDLNRIRHWLFDGPQAAGLRRLPQDIAGWPAMQRQVMPVDLDPSARMAYATLWADFVRAEMQRETSGLRGPQKTQEAERNRLRLRQQASWLRIPSTATLAQELLDQGKRVAVSVAFRDTQEELARLLRKAGVEVALIHGEHSKPRNEQERLRFQRGEATVAIFTVEEAISLHQGEHEDVPRVMLLHDVRWSAIQLAQIEGRCHRDGALAPVWWLVAAGTVEMAIAERMVDRVIGMKSMHGDPTGDLEVLEGVIKAAIEREAALMA